jgi:hypothetical protein
LKYLVDDRTGKESSVTTQEDWAFRAVHLRQAADRLDRKAEEFRKCAEQWRKQAERADQLANQPQEATPAEMDQIELDAAVLLY